MKKLSFLVVFAVTFFFLSISHAEDKPRLGVLKFSNTTNAGWWSSNMGTDLQEMLTNELAAIDSFAVLERQQLDAVIKEQDLGVSGRISKSTRSKLGNITGAQYLVSGTVSAYEESTKGTGGGFRFGVISLGGKQEKAYLAVDLKLIEVETGEIADQRTVEATSKGGGLSVGLDIGDFSGDFGGFAKTPAGKAVRACLMEIVDYLDCSLIEGKDAPCMADYNTKESSRRERTKGAISLE